MSTSSAGARPAVFPVVATSAQSRVHADAKASGYTQGHAAGYAAGLQLAALDAADERARTAAEHARVLAALNARTNAELAALRTAGQALGLRTAPVLADAEQTLFACALELAQALLGSELRDGETSARAALARALDHDGADVPLRIRMNPSDIATLTGLDAGTAAGVDLAPDPALNPGDAIAEFPHGYLDATIAAAVARARTALLGDALPGHALPGAIPAGTP
ncbi:hypothetical protein AL755_00320 (plasmid) [Arthrobacter sp. ERGS1:01]|uniref:FliH/SctL family protein n=1 Tax=Arthrobacter sp. ERGS1:01 TaxID=1704044 RepID=UPI0006CB2E11|nr:FliH/SctL family protein [Arthrobacter sp. ERGS1:01]ALE04205.1 hypothetical protein AL755_00320 [Arthrobacter sp. ERGS1:01]